MSLDSLHLCIRCKHHRDRSKAILFGAAELQSPGVLKARTEWDQQQRQRAQQEQQRLASGIPFDYEPHHFAWCAAYTQTDLARRARKGDEEALRALLEQGMGAINPVTGEISLIYVLCAQANPTGNCERYEPE